MAKTKITKDSLISEILELPQGRKILTKYNLPCLGCPFAGYELGSLKIGDVCKMYGINLKKLLKELNESIKK